MSKAATIRELRERIENAKNIQRLEQITIDSCSELLEVLEGKAGPTPEQKFRAITPLDFKDFDTPKQ